MGPGRRLRRLSRSAASAGIELGAVNPNLFGEDDYRLGSLCSPDGAVRAKALRHLAECVEIARSVDSTILSLWLADGTSYAGQDDLRERSHRLVTGLEQTYALLDPEMTLLVEYKFFEPAFHSTDLPDWGTASLLCRRLGPQARVLVDTGHHPQGTNIEQIVARLLAENLLGGFHFNNRKYADDDLIVGSVDPFELFRIMSSSRTATSSSRIALMIDQAHNVEGKIDAMIQSVVEHPDGLREGAPDRPGSSLRRRSAPVTCSAPTASCSTPTRATSGRSSPVTASATAFRWIPSPPTARAAMPSSASRIAASPPSRARTSRAERLRPTRPGADAARAARAG